LSQLEQIAPGETNRALCS